MHGNVLGEGVADEEGGMVLFCAGVVLPVMAVVVGGEVEGFRVVVGGGALVLGGGGLLKGCGARVAGGWVGLGAAGTSRTLRQGSELNSRRNKL